MAIKDVFRGVAQSTRKRFYDNFNRTNQSGLGTATDGSTWNTLRGSFSISSNTAVGVDTNYPMANQTMPFSNVEIDLLGTTQGSAASLWVTDSGNWWAVGMTQEPESCNCTYYYTASTNYYTGYTAVYTAGNLNSSYTNGNWNVANCNATTCTGGYNASNCATANCVAYNGTTCNNYACNGYNAYVCNSYNAYNSKTKTGGNCNAYSGGNCAGYRCSGSYNAVNCAAYGCSAYNTQTCISYTCNAYNSYYYNGNVVNGYYNAPTLWYYNTNTESTTTYSGPFASCSTCYPQYIRIIQSVANTVSVVTQWSIGTLAQSLKIKTSGSQITVSAYSDTSLVTQIGSDLIYTPTGVAVTPVFGLTVIPSSYNQGYATDSIEIKKN
jgi:hypothetical protein